jgi:catechol 2,3-dioxygenase-like lactoylglutathione lyase family enzyme
VITGAHGIVFAEDPQAARAFFGEALGMRAVDAGGGWLIFALPPAELACHPTAPAESGRHELFLMCDDVEATVSELKAKGVEFVAPITDEAFGRMTRMRVPGGGELGLYEPTHPSPLDDLGREERRWPRPTTSRPTRCTSPGTPATRPC